MRYADLSPSTQLFLMGALVAVLASLLTRAVVFFRREKEGLRPLYPTVWSAAQCRTLECFRLLVGLALIPLWGAFLFVAPSMPSSWPFGYLEMISLISLLLISNAWVMLLVPRNWKMLGAFSRSFSLTISFLVVWWVSTFAAAGWMLARASASPPPKVMPVGVFVAHADETRSEPNVT
jgi:hypothetical protein